MIYNMPADGFPQDPSPNSGFRARGVDVREGLWNEGGMRWFRFYLVRLLTKSPQH